MDTNELQLKLSNCELNIALHNGRLRAWTEYRQEIMDELNDRHQELIKESKKEEEGKIK
jgi:hypothetical protein